jgi:small subunit ribosomal protein S1
MKQLESDPMDGGYPEIYFWPPLHRKITNITDYGAFVELEPGIEGLVHVSEMSWTKKNVHIRTRLFPLVKKSDVQVLDIDMDKRRISLGIKQTQDNPWSAFAASHQVGQELEGEIRNITEFGLFVGLQGDIDGMVHLSDVSWDDSSEEALKAYKKGDMVKVRILDIDAAKERVALGIKQMTEDKGSEAPCQVFRKVRLLPVPLPKYTTKVSKSKSTRQ